MNEQELADNLDRLLSDPSSAESVEDQELGQLVRLSQRLEHLKSAQAEVSPHFRQGLKKRIDLQRREAVRRELARPRSAVNWVLRLRAQVWARGLAGAAVLLTVFLFGGAATYAATSALPGDGLYGVKSVIEQGRLASAAPWRQVELHIQYANTRLTEIQYLTVERRYTDAEVAAQALSWHLDQADRLLQDVEREDPARARSLAQHLNRMVVNHEQVLAGILIYVPISSRPALEGALEATKSRMLEEDAIRIGPPRF
jgi:hypothetical protein